MEGAALAARKQLDTALFAAWHTALFALNGWADKGKLAGGKSLADLMDHSPKPQGAALKHAQAIAFFHRLRAKGMSVKITRETIN